MEREVQEILYEPSKCLLRERYARAAEFLAPWLENDPIGDGLEAVIEARVARTRETFADPCIGPPDTVQLDDNLMNVSDLRQDGVVLPVETTDDNFLAWCCISIQANEGKQSLYDIWCAVVPIDDVCESDISR
jgi:hypothetical protein